MHPTIKSNWELFGTKNHSGREAPEAPIHSYKPAHEGRSSVQESVAIKGTRNGLLLTLESDTPFQELLQALAYRLNEAPAFFQGACLTVDTSQRALRVSERIQLEKLLANYQMSIASTSQEKQPTATKEAKTITLPPETSPITTQITQQFGNQVPITPASRDSREVDDTLYLRRTIRSGQAIHHRSSIVILGDVNPGAEIVAGGDIIVWGVLRGMVHAGYPDNDQALVCSLQFAPVQLRIAHLLSRPPEDFEALPRPEVASIRNGQIVVEAWISGRPPRR
jgi:septum site-determining protein MinC